MPTNTASIDIHIDYAADDSCQIQLWARGHHQAEAFLTACESELLRWDGRKMDLAGKPVIHAHWRTVQPSAEIRERGVCDTIHIPSKPGKGAYGVTILDDWLPLHRDYTGA